MTETAGSKVAAIILVAVLVLLAVMIVRNPTVRSIDERMDDIRCERWEGRFADPCPNREERENGY